MRFFTADPPVGLLVEGTFFLYLANIFDVLYCAFHGESGYNYKLIFKYHTARLKDEISVV